MPQATSAGTNLYAWCGNNPVNRVDPSGLWSLREFGASVGAAAGSLLGCAGLGAAVGGAIGGYADQAMGYLGYSSPSYNGGGNYFSGQASRARSRARVSVKKQADPPKPVWTRNGPSGIAPSTSKVGRTVYPYHFLSGGDTHRIATYTYIDGGYDSVAARIPAAWSSSQTGEYGGINIMINQGADFSGRYAGADSFSARLGSGISGTMAVVDYATGLQDSLNKIDLGIEACFATAGVIGVNVNPWVAAGYHGLGKPLINPDQTVSYFKDNSQCTACHGY